jgi:hypothetical protein
MRGIRLLQRVMICLSADDNQPKIPGYSALNIAYYRQEIEVCWAEVRIFVIPVTCLYSMTVADENDT